MTMREDLLEIVAREIDPPAFDPDETVDLREGRVARAYAAAGRVLTALSAAGVDLEGWRPIESAPKGEP